MRLRLSAALAAASPTAPSNAEGDPQLTQGEILDEGLAPIAYPFIGRFVWTSERAFLDFTELDLRGDGTYAAKVEATLVNPGVRTFGGLCTLPEEGLWNGYKVAKQTRIRIRPTTSRARVYVAEMNDDRIVL